MNSFSLKYILLVILQILLWEFFDISQLMLLCIVPTLILCLPTRVGTTASLILAFVTALVLDFFCGSPLGLSIAALLPVAACRRIVVRLVFGAEIYFLGENLSYKRHGWVKFLLGILLMTSVFLIVYILLDSAGTRALWIDILKFICSLALSTIISMYVVSILCSESDNHRR